MKRHCPVLGHRRPVPSGSLPAVSKVRMCQHRTWTPRCVPQKGG